ncbi:MAG: flagellar hook protein FlgE, partial [Spirochaetales bacterium]|nr:flagellar hook protein FlgE [Spirochaetales bacterium]
MMRSLYSGVSGLQNHQTRMDVIGNNISNVNTVGFKKGRVTFQDMISQSTAGASSPTEDLGGVNPKQVGLGMSVASIDTIHTQGSLQSTGVATDLAVQGNGFFIMAGGDKEYYTRAGAFGVDENGTLVNPSNGMKVQGWMAETVDGKSYINTASDAGDLIIPVGGKDPASATREVELACNVDKRYEVIPDGAGDDVVRKNTWTIDKDIYDNFGNVHKMQIEFTKLEGTQNSWQGTVTVDPGDEAGTNTLAEIGAENNGDNTFIVNFNNLGTLQSINDAQGDAIDTGDLNVQVSFDVQGATENEDGTPQRQTFNLNIGEAGSVVNSMTQFAESSSTKAFRQDGYGMGYLENFKIDQTGTITGVYSNGTNRTLGQLALATFSNQNGLEKAGDSTFVVT